MGSANQEHGILNWRDGHADTTLQQRFPNLDFGVAPIPYFEKGKPVTPTGAWHFAINPRTRNQAQTLTFLNDFMTEELHSLWFKLRPYPPVLKSIWDSEKATFDTETS
jgi:multiple sugar transport system substrate-binding protein